MTRVDLVADLEKRARLGTALMVGGATAGTFQGELLHSLLEDKNVISGKDRQGQALNSLAFMGAGGLTGLLVARRLAKRFRLR